MSLQLATRAAVLRHLRLGEAIIRPGRVTGLQNQFRSLTISSEPRLTPRVGGLSAIANQQSHTYATDASAPKKSTKTADGEPKKPKKQIKKKTASPKPRKKPEPTERQKELKAKEKQRDLIKKLKETALEPPAKLKSQPHHIAFKSKFAEIKSQYSTVPEAFSATVAAIKTIPANEFERYQNQAEENRAANEASFTEWLQSYTPLQIKEANHARRTLTRLTGKRFRSIEDDRLVKRPISAFLWYINERKSSGDLKYMEPHDLARRVAEEWKSLTESDKEPYRKIQIDDTQRYVREYKDAYGVEPKLKKRD
ncbi:hypothetical protein N7466_002688 [Penicillium verhagenii]|uniref:uncharacterized protein n=1 Tax=Penicillium verhagenii TaxID=1562060 RepID=UPI002545BD3A|nr:uncharacterized protein N7466_002688 [Penicillium verhagenii]KAJ5939554.1 hypothetical protein N7466_002688 [Penicillium verhagenii]